MNELEREGLTEDKYEKIKADAEALTRHENRPLTETEQECIKDLDFLGDQTGYIEEKIENLGAYAQKLERVVDDKAFDTQELTSMIHSIDIIHNLLRSVESNILSAMIIIRKSAGEHDMDIYKKLMGFK